MRIIYTQRYKEIATTAVETLEKASVSCQSISPFEIARNLKIRIRKYSEIAPDDKAILLAMQKDGFSNLLIKDQFSTPIFYIWYNDEMPEERVRWTIAHEIGHIMLGHLEESQLAEAEADYFAGILLVAPIFKRVQKLTTIPDVQRIFGLNIEATTHTISRYKNRYMYGNILKKSESRICQVFCRDSHTNQKGIQSDTDTPIPKTS